MSQKKGRETVGKRQYSKKSWLRIFKTDERDPADSGGNKSQREIRIHTLTYQSKTLKHQK